ncbi:MAG: bifunctional metallophosphatase/5'-nucleotidase [Bacteroidales bacterium]|nr:bifunctional metallophosphatase/5'-nucleotidase [Bacteroidales bacterium]
MKNPYFLFSVFLLFATPFLLSCSSEERPQQLQIKIIETSDVHGAIMPYDLVEDKATKSSLAQVHTYVEQERANKDQVVILLDNGDILQGDPMVYFYNYERTDTVHLVASVMNYMRYDAATVGNHDIEAGHPVYDRLRDAFRFPWLAANAINTKSRKPYFKPYTMLEFQGVKVAVLGMITPAIPKWLPPDIWSGMEFQDMIESAKYWVEEIKSTEKPDLLIGLFHAGVDYTYGQQQAETPMNENASRLVAEQVPGFDIVFVGHDHEGWNEQIDNWAGHKVLLLGTTSRAHDVAVASIRLQLNNTTGHYKKNITGEIVEMIDFAPDSAFIRKFSPALLQVQEYVSEPLGTIGHTISSRESFFGDAAFTDMIHQAQLEQGDATISFTAPLSMDRQLDAGPLFVRDLFKMYRFENLLYTMKLGGQEIKDYLEYSAGLWVATMTAPDDHLLLFATDSTGTIIRRNGKARLEKPFYNLDDAEGISYTVDVRRPAGTRVDIISLADGTPFDFNKTYRVAVNSYRGNGGGGHLTTGARIPQELLQDRILQSTEKDFRFYLMQWIRENKTIAPQVTNNWKIVPEKWVENAKKTDRKLLFGEPQ